MQVRTDGGGRIVAAANFDLMRGPDFGVAAQPELHVRGVCVSEVGARYQEDAMNARAFGGMLFGVLVLSMVSLSAITEPMSSAEPWPPLLSETVMPLDPQIAGMQQRASEALERLLRPSDSLAMLAADEPAVWP